MNSAYLITPVAGAVIGYLTNWIAIKMLFRPHHEVRVLGVKLPFTPGLIPKERVALAKKVGGAVSEHVITPDVLVNAVLSPEAMGSLNVALSENLMELQKSQLTVEEQLTIFFGADLDKMIVSMEEGLVHACQGILNHTSFQKEISRLLTKKIIIFLKEESLAGRSKKIIGYIRPILVEHFNVFFAGDDFKEMLERNIEIFYNGLLVNEYFLSHYISEKNAMDIKAFVRGKMPDMARFLIKLLTENGELDIQLNLLTRRVIDQNIGKLAGMFLNKDGIYDSIKEGILAFLSDESQYDILAEKLWQKVDPLMEKDIKSLAQKLPEQIKEQILQKATALAENSVGKNSADKMLAFIEAQLQKSEEIYLFNLVEKFRPNWEEELNQFILERLNQFFTNEALKIVEGFISSMKTKLLSTPIRVIAEAINGDKAERIKKSLWKAIELLLKKGSHYVVESVDIGKMVEEQLNKFEIEEAEEIVISVVNRELNAITILGGVLGFVIGVGTVFLQMI